MFVTCPAYAEWIDIGRSTNNIKAIFLDNDVQDYGGYCTMWVRQIYNYQQRSGNITYCIRQDLLGFYFDISGGRKTIKKDKIFFLASVAYNANGEVVFSTEPHEEEKWEQYIIKDSLAETFADYAEEFYLQKF